jgi:hypothetical protein
VAEYDGQRFADTWNTHDRGRCAPDLVPLFSRRADLHKRLLSDAECFRPLVRSHYGHISSIECGRQLRW